MHDATRHHHTPANRLSASTGPIANPNSLKRAEMICLAAACEAAVHDAALEPHVELVMQDVEAWARWACENASAAGWWEMQDATPAVAQALRRYMVHRRLTGATVTHATTPLLDTLPPILRPVGAVA